MAESLTLRSPNELLNAIREWISIAFQRYHSFHVNWNGYRPQNTDDPRIVSLEKLRALTKAIVLWCDAENRNLNQADLETFFEFVRKYTYSCDILITNDEAGTTVNRTVPRMELGRLWREADAASNRIKLLAELMTNPNQNRADVHPAHHSDDFRSVNWFGVDHEFTANQAACVKVLWENWEKGCATVGDQTILLAADAASERLPLVFRKHKAWGTMIVKGMTKGSHKLAPPKKILANNKNQR